MDLAHERRDAVARLPAAGRLRDMHRRIARRLEDAGIDAGARERVLDANAAALLHRRDVLGDDEHFEALHPARTLLILLDDCDVIDADLLEAAASIESEHAELRVAPRGALARAVPTPLEGEDSLAEALVVESAEVRLIALAERLDHARHLHLRPAAAWPRFHETIGAVYRPVAQRTHPRLARRYDWWWRMFGRRFLKSAEFG